MKNYKNYLDDYQCIEFLELRETLEKMYFPQLSRKYPQVEDLIKELKGICSQVYRNEFNNENVPWETYRTKSGKMKRRWKKE